MGKNLKKRKKGAALLTAVLLSAIVGTVAIGVSAIAIRQVNISETYSNGLAAFYSSESGLEEGLLRFRFDKNAEVPFVIEDAAGNLGRVPVRKYRSMLDRTPMSSYSPASDGSVNYYLLSDRQQVYDLQTYFRQRYYGDDVNGDGFINANDLNDTSHTYSDYYTLAKDDQKDFAITGADKPSTDNRIYLYWRWTTPCNSAAKYKRALEVKLKVNTAASGLPTDRDEYTALFEDTTCPTPIANADTPVNLGNGIFAPIGGGSDLKAKMNILSLKVTSMSLKSIGGANSDKIIFGFNQGNQDGGVKVAGPTTTIKSLGYFAGITNQITAEVDRQTGTILDLFNYVLYKGK